MGMSDRRKQVRAKKKAQKEARMKGPKSRSESKYALKRRGIYPPGSPYLTGAWGQPCRKLRQAPVIESTPTRNPLDSPNARALAERRTR